jgi:hypothetical protein
MKLLFFVEGESEKNCVVGLIRKFYPNIIIVSSLTEYIQSAPPTGRHYCYVDDCESNEGIPFRINERIYILELSKTDLIIIFCDIEKNMQCATNRLQRIYGLLDENIDRQKVKVVLSRLTIESIYWRFPEIMKKSIKLIYSARKSGRTAPLFNVVDNINENHVFELDKLMKALRMSYKKPEFAEYFFPRIPSLNEFDRSETLMRLKSVLDAV